MHPTPFVSLRAKQWCGHRVFLDLRPQSGPKCLSLSKVIIKSNFVTFFPAKVVKWIIVAVKWAPPTVIQKTMETGERLLQPKFLLFVVLDSFCVLPSQTLKTGFCVIFYFFIFLQFNNQQLFAPVLGWLRGSVDMQFFFPLPFWEKFDPSFFLQTWKCVGTFPR